MKLLHALTFLPLVTSNSHLSSLSSQSRSSIQESIINGVEVDDAQFSTNYNYLASLQTSTNFHYCGGTIVSPHHIITASHCLEPSAWSDPSSHSDIFIVVGAADRGLNTEVNRFKVEEIIAHPCYDAAMTNYDIAVLRVEEDLLEGTGARSIPWAIPGTDMYATGSKVSTSGWGTTVSGSGTAPNFLMTTEYEITSNEVCGAAYSMPTIPGTTLTGLPETMICGSGTNADGLQTDSCQGDSGGPLVTVTSEGETLLGVTSFGIGCALPEYPGVYAKVEMFHKFLDWAVSNGPNTFDGSDGQCSHLPLPKVKPDDIQYCESPYDCDQDQIDVFNALYGPTVGATATWACEPVEGCLYSDFPYGPFVSTAPTGWSGDGPFQCKCDDSCKTCGFFEFNGEFPSAQPYQASADQCVGASSPTHNSRRKLFGHIGSQQKMCKIQVSLYTEGSCAEGCPPNWPGDNFCDQSCNNEECNFDNGDCDGDNNDDGPPPCVPEACATIFDPTSDETATCAALTAMVECIDGACDDEPSVSGPWKPDDIESSGVLGIFDACLCQVDETACASLMGP
ncbi:hypothetical protein TL16_g10368 [Triparma laevis f. inornata]|uniref:Peptidase S1 domain-containing protein n=1 Tax=Triparma laevis f. inornata TaxID=1714386 RepID=A0A9W7ENP1_9STRA|nr:hypothetical protein TL16_g10368 [Triparma laevis f. inornata]